MIGNNLKETQQKLINIIGFDYEMFKSTSCFEQGESDCFSKLTPKEAKQLIMKLLYLDEYEKYERIVKDKINLLEDELNRMTIKKITIEEQAKLQSIDIDKVKDEYNIDEKNYQILEPEFKRLIDKQKLYSKILVLEEQKNKFTNLNKCPTCLRDIDIEYKNEISNRFQKTIDEIKLEFGNSKEQYEEIEILLNATKNRMIKNKAILSKYSSDLKNTTTIDLGFKIIDLKDAIIMYKKLSVAFGRNGIPSLIIEQAIPEIENITNNILSDLDIDMQLRLELQKELKGGGISDTLDILIQTNKYTRSYFNYSGGEKFLIDLSLRIALSTILLRRKGCNNSTLILDEGLGSLDRVNREKVLKLISILNEKFGFLKILIISHISEIQDSIGNKIYIRMKNGCSEVRNEL